MSPTPHRKSRALRPRPPHRAVATPLLATAALVFGVACSDGSSPPTSIDREVFVTTYVDLRIAALESDSAALTEAARAEVLSRHGVTADDLLGFAEAHGRDVEFMRDVWNEVEVRMDARRPGSGDEG